MRPRASLRRVLDDLGVTLLELVAGEPPAAQIGGGVIDAPVTIEDRSSRVLAFSGRQDEADRSRVETILGRQVPERYSRMLTERGVFRDLYRSDQPVYIEPPGGLADFIVPRAAVAVRAG